VSPYSLCIASTSTESNQRSTQTTLSLLHITDCVIFIRLRIEYYNQLNQSGNGNSTTPDSVHRLFHSTRISRLSSMSDTETHTTTRVRVVILEGHDNYNSWLRSINNQLLIKDLSHVVDGTDLYPNGTSITDFTIRSWEKLDRKSWGLIDSSLSDVIHGNIPAELAIYTPPTLTSSLGCSARLMAYIKATYSATQGSRKAELWRIIWRTDLAEGVSPMARLSSIRTAHSDLVNSGTVLADSDLAYAILMSLPESYSTIVQSLYLVDKISSSAVISAINTEWRRRDTGDSTALLSRISKSKPDVQQWSRDPNKYCDNHKSNGHATNECRFPPKKSSANIVENKVKVVDLPESTPAMANITTSSLNSAFLASTSISPAVLLAHSSALDIIVDSGASHHMVHDRNLLTKIVRLDPPVSITVGNGSIITAVESGQLELRNVRLEGVLHAPDLGRNLLSVSKSNTSGSNHWVFTNGKATLFHKGKHVASAHLDNGLYVLNRTSAPTPSTALISNSTDSVLHHWHCRLGHLGVRDVVKLGREGRLDNRVDWVAEGKGVSKFSCTSCIFGKGTRLPAPPNATRATKPLRTVHCDLWGPARTPTIGGATYFLTCYDDYTRKINLTFLKKKSDTRQALVEYIVLVENQLDCTVKTIRSDLGGEFGSHDLKAHLASRGIEHHQTPPDSHAQNGRVERVHLTILNAVRTLLHDSDLPDKFWGEAANYAAYTRNRVPCGPLKQVPEDLWRNQLSSLSHLQPFGSRAYFRDHMESDKLHVRYREGRLMSYVEGTSTYRIWDNTKQCIVLTRDVVFDHTKHDSIQLTGTPPPLKRFNTELRVFEDVLDTEETEELPVIPINPPEEQAPPPVRRNPPRNARPEQYRPITQEPVLEPKQPVIAQPRLQFDGVEVPTRNLRLIDHGNNLLAHALISTGLPQTFNQARHLPDWPEWNEAIKSELDKMDKYQVWDVIKRPVGERILKAKWVFTRKIDGDTGKVAAYKARWVARGFAQVEGVDYNELYAGVAHKDSIRVFLALVNHLDFECDQVDIKAAFLNGELEETILLEAPEGSTIPADSVLRLRKSLYGLKQSPRCFNKSLDQWLRSEGLTPTHADPCIYTLHIGSTTLLLSVHVDDQLIACNSRSELDSFKQRLNARFECSDGGPASYFLGFNIHRDRPHKKLYVSQEHYIESVLERFDMSDSKPVKVPLPTSFRSIPATDEEHSMVKHIDYPGMVGALMYAATITRPDIAHAAGLLARTASKWNKDHVHAARHLLRYLRGTSDLCLTFDDTAGQRIVLGYADADWGGCLDTRRVTVLRRPANRPDAQLLESATVV